MIRSIAAVPGPRLGLFVAGVLACNLILALGIARQGAFPPVALALLPGAALLFGLLTVSHRDLLVFAALALNMTAGPFNEPLIGPLYVADFLVALAFGSWLTAALLGLRGGARPSWPETPVLSWPLLLLGGAMVLGMVRGNELYGTTPFGQPLRLIVYAAIAAALVGSNPQRLYRGVVTVFYVGTVWLFLVTVYHLASGTSQTDAARLSTGGTRVVAGTVSVYLAIALFLALVNLQIDRSVAKRLLHIGVGGLAAFGTVLAYTRAVYIAVAILLPVVLLIATRTRGALASVFPFFLPFIVAGIIYVPRAVPDLVPTFVNRVTSPAADDLNVRFRQTANATSMDLVEESPLLGTGFGRTITFSLEGKRYEVAHGSHNSYLWLLTGGGILALASFALVLGGFALDAFRRLKHAVDLRERALITWSLVALSVILIAAAGGPLLSSPSTLLTIWVLMLLPSAVPRRWSAEPVSAAHAPRGAVSPAEST